MKKYLSLVFIFVFLLTFVLPFKSSHALSPTVPCTIFDSDLKFTDGDNNTDGDISRLQGFLNAYQGSSLKIDGFYGISTLKEVIKFQKDNSISPSVGYVGSVTRAKIQEVSCKPVDPLPNVLIDFKATPDSVQFGGSTVLTWNVENANKCTAGFDWSGEKLLTGSQIISNLEKTSIFSLTCTNVLGEKVAKSVDVGVYIVDNFEPNVTVVSPNGGEVFNPGDTFTVNYQTKNSIPSDKISLSLIYYKPENGSYGQVILNTTSYLSNSLQHTVKIPNTEELKSIIEKYGNKFKIAVYLVEDKSFPTASIKAYDDSDSFFTINNLFTFCPENTVGIYPNCIDKTKPNIKLTPLQEKIIFENLTPKLTQKVSWVTKDVPDNSWVNLEVRGFELKNDLETRDLGTLFLERNLPLNGSFEYKINAQANVAYYVRITLNHDNKKTNIDSLVLSEDLIKLNIKYDGSCPEGTTGVYPNCKKIEIPPIECPFGYTGQYPNCVKIETPSPSCLELTYNLKITDRDSFTKGEVSKLQNFLKLQGYLNENATGYFGTATLGAVIKFQKANNISPAVGYVGAYTRAKIKEVSCNTIYGSGANNNSVKVVSPKNTDSFELGQKITIKVAGLNSSVIDSFFTDTKLEYVKNTKLADFDLNAFNNATWTIQNSSEDIEYTINNPAEIASFDALFTDQIHDEYSVDFYGKNFRIALTTKDGKKIYSDLFTIAPKGFIEGCKPGVSYSVKANKPCPEIKIISPNGGEIFEKGSQQQIKWETKNLPIEAKVGLRLVDSKNNHIQKIYDYGDNLNGSYMYEVPLEIDCYPDSGNACASDIDYVSGFKIHAYLYIDVSVPNRPYYWNSNPKIFMAEDFSDNTFKISPPPSCFNGLQDFGETGIDVGGPCGEIFNSCPQGTTGTYPNCKEITPECPVGYYGIYPNCVLPPIQTPSTSSNIGCEIGYKYSVITGQPCSLQTQTTDNSDSITTTTTDKTPRIAYWSGKVNQHIDQNGNWQTDPDGASGSSLDKLGYCRKWYPTTTSVRDYKVETINTWRAGGNLGVYSSSRMTIECVGGSVAGVLGASITNSQNSCTLNTNLMKGIKSEQVKCLQQKLNQKGYQVVGTEGGKETTEFGYYTMQALRKFQKDNNLTVDGILGKNTRKLLNE